MDVPAFIAGQKAVAEPITVASITGSGVRRSTTTAAAFSVRVEELVAL